jgi:hypothetical protein
MAGCLTWGKPDRPEMHVSEMSEVRKASSCSAGVLSKGAGPGAVGSISTPSGPSSCALTT